LAGAWVDGGGDGLAAVDAAAKAGGSPRHVLKLFPRR
jgi:hypothetical protein